MDTLKFKGDEYHFDFKINFEDIERVEEDHEGTRIYDYDGSYYTSEPLDAVISQIVKHDPLVKEFDELLKELL